MLCIAAVIARALRLARIGRVFLVMRGLRGQGGTPPAPGRIPEGWGRHWRKQAAKRRGTCSRCSLGWTGQQCIHRGSTTENDTDPWDDERTGY